MERRVNTSRILMILFTLLLIWCALQFLAPIMLPSNSIRNLTGLPGVEDNVMVIRRLSFPWNIVYSIGDRLCHQKASRSLFINGNQMPFCARCTGIWIGLAIGLGVSIIYKFELSQRLFILIITCIIPLVVDGTGQLVGLWESNNPLRLVTGVTAGVVTGVAISVIVDGFREEFFQKLYKYNGF